MVPIDCRIINLPIFHDTIIIIVNEDHFKYGNMKLKCVGKVNVFFFTF